MHSGVCQSTEMFYKVATGSLSWCRGGRILEREKGTIQLEGKLVFADKVMQW